MPEERLRWTGAGTFSAPGFGYLHATVPLVVVELEGARLTVRLRPAVLARLIGARPLNVTAGDGLQVFAVRSNATYQGIEFRPAQKSSFYFFTRERGEIFAALANAASRRMTSAMPLPEHSLISVAGGYARLRPCCSTT